MATLHLRSNEQLAERAAAAMGRQAFHTANALKAELDRRTRGKQRREPKIEREINEDETYDSTIRPFCMSHEDDPRPQEESHQYVRGGKSSPNLSLIHI